MRFHTPAWIASTAAPSTEGLLRFRAIPILSRQAYFSARKKEDLNIRHKGEKSEKELVRYILAFDCVVIIYSTTTNQNAQVPTETGLLLWFLHQIWWESTDISVGMTHVMVFKWTDSSYCPKITLRDSDSTCERCGATSDSETLLENCVIGSWLDVKNFETTLLGSSWKFT